MLSNTLVLLFLAMVTTLISLAGLAAHRTVVAVIFFGPTACIVVASAITAKRRAPMP